MVKITIDVQNNAIHSTLIPAAASVPSAYKGAPDAVRRKLIFVYPQEISRTFIRCACQRHS